MQSVHSGVFRHSAGASADWTRRLCRRQLRTTNFVWCSAAQSSSYRCHSRSESMAEKSERDINIQAHREIEIDRKCTGSFNRCWWCRLQGNSQCVQVWMSALVLLSLLQFRWLLLMQLFARGCFADKSATAAAAATATAKVTSAPMTHLWSRSASSVEVRWVRTMACTSAAAAAVEWIVLPFTFSHALSPLFNVSLCATTSALPPLLTMGYTGYSPPPLQSIGSAKTLSVMDRTHKLFPFVFPSLLFSVIFFLSNSFFLISISRQPCAGHWKA